MNENSQVYQRKHCSTNATSVFTESQKLSCGDPCFKHSGLYELYPMEKTHTGAVLEELQAMGRTYTGAVFAGEQRSGGRGGKNTLDGCQVRSKPLLSRTGEENKMKKACRSR